MPFASTYSLLILIECKHYKAKSVPVGDIEEFFQKVQQVASGNRKAILASNAAFDAGTRTFAASNGIGLLRYSEPANAKWELYRPPILEGQLRGAKEADRVRLGLSLQAVPDHSLHLFMQCEMLLTSSFLAFLQELTTPALSPEELRSCRNPVQMGKNIVPYLESKAIEGVTIELLQKFGYTEGPVSLQRLCEMEESKSGLKVILNEPFPSPFDDLLINPPLGKITFSPLEIKIFSQPEPNVGRERYTLAHELGHYYLGHSRYFAGEYCDDLDFTLRELAQWDEIVRLEYQANYFASCLLMPAKQFLSDFQKTAAQFDIRNRGYGPLYVDNNPWNVQNFYNLTGVLMQLYQVSRKAVAIRLETLSMLNDQRNAPARQ
jgi:hypothetical protein